MFIIAGRRPITEKVGEGYFHCPRCRGTQKYEHKTARQHVHVYFIPVAPAGEAHEFIECQACKGTFRKEVLLYNPKLEKGSFEAVFEKAVRKVLVHTMMADHSFKDSEISQIQATYARLTGSQISAAKINLEALKALGPGGLRRSLRRLAPLLNDEGRRVVLEAARSVAKADGGVQVEESELLERLASALGMAAPDYHNYMAESQR